MDVVAMVPTLPEDSIIVSLPFGGAVLRSLGYSTEEVNVLLEDTRKKFVLEKGKCPQEGGGVLVLPVVACNSRKRGYDGWVRLLYDFALCLMSRE